MNSKTKTIVGLVLLVLVIVGATFAYNQLSAQFSPETALDDIPQKGEPAQEKIPAPDFTAYDEKGNAVKLSDYFGTPIVLNFWATWCGYCKEEMPYFNTMSQETQGEVTFLMVDVVDGVQETKEKGAAYITESGFTFPVLYDSDQSAATTYGITGLPTTLFIDIDGNVVAAVEGRIDETTLKKGVDLIKGQAITAK